MLLLELQTHGAACTGKGRAYSITALAGFGFPTLVGLGFQSCQRLGFQHERILKSNVGSLCFPLATSGFPTLIWGQSSSCKAVCRRPWCPVAVRQFLRYLVTATFRTYGSQQS